MNFVFYTENDSLCYYTFGESTGNIHVLYNNIVEKNISLSTNETVAINNLMGNG